MTSERRGILLVAAAALLWSTGGIGIKWLSEPPLKIAFYRSATAAVALFVIFRPRIWRWTPAFLIGIASYAACLTTFVLATKWTSAANAIFLQYCGVVWVLLASPLVLKEPFHRRDAGAIGVAFLGMLLFFVGKFESRGYSGEIAALSSSVFFATWCSRCDASGAAAPRRSSPTATCSPRSPSFRSCGASSPSRRSPPSS